MRQKKQHKKRISTHTRSGVHTKLLRRRMHMSIFIFAGSMLIASAAYFFVSSQSFLVRDISVSGGDEKARGDVQDHVQIYIKASIDENNLDTRKGHMFFLRKQDIIASIADAFPQVSDIQIDRIFPHALNITLTLHDMIIVVCAQEDQAKEACALIGDNGIALGRADIDAPSMQANEVLFFSSTEGVPAKNEPFFTEEVIDHLRFIVRELPFEVGISVSRNIEIVARTEQSVRLTTDAGWSVIIDGSRDPRLTILVLKEFLTKTHDTKTQLEEIDLRIKDRVFYKRRS